MRRAVIDFAHPAGSIARMGKHELRHLAVIAGTAPRGADAAGAILASCAKAADIARAAFAAVPGLRAFSWAAPAVDRLLAHAAAPAAARAKTKAERALAETAAALGAALRICGRDASPAGELALTPGAEDARTLLWFRSYGGRDEIVRAAGRFFAARPGRRLEDGELDAWLDTAGVPDPDLLLFAGGPLEPHDTLLWQGSYAEIWHTTADWTAFTEADLKGALEDYHARHRRFGR